MMSITKPFNTSYGFLPRLHVKPSHRSQIRIALNSCSSFGGNSRRLKMDDRRRRTFLVCNVVQPEAPPPSKPPFNFFHKWGSLLRLKNEVETAVEVAEEVAEATEKVAEGVEKLAEEIAEDLPEGGRLRKVVDFVEHVAERASKDAHIVDDFIDKVQEVEEKVEEYVESLAEEVTNDKHPKEEEEDRAYEETRPRGEDNDKIKLPKEEISSDNTQKH
ncbi:hypothetical protein CDL12_14371 [Handroanthus impetiginosus]|uniref:Uncharacterized protein n=1 Tax=Handroanthus impetiginosus TaxID=429701 RepID=A0A2G9H664_9LAMI|nr:hypothetical protein CDL12_14371 [Handroanthus impetiginosus]